MREAAVRVGWPRLGNDAVVVKGLVLGAAAALAAGAGAAVAAGVK